MQTLKKRKEFSYVYKKGSAQGARSMTLVCLPRKYGDTKVGFSVSKKIGCAVVRNRTRRRMKEAYRAIEENVFRPCLLIFVAKPPITELGFTELKDEMTRLLKKKLK